MNERDCFMMLGGILGTLFFVFSCGIVAMFAFKRKL